MRLIDADKLKKSVLDLPNCYNGFSDTYDKACIIGVVDEQPTIKPEPKEGMWIERESGTEDKQEGWPTVIVRSQCDFPATTFYSEDCECRTQIKTRFCPNCGARMVMK